MNKDDDDDGGVTNDEKESCSKFQKASDAIRSLHALSGTCEVR